MQTRRRRRLLWCWKSKRLFGRTNILSTIIWGDLQMLMNAAGCTLLHAVGRVRHIDGGWYVSEMCWFLWRALMITEFAWTASWSVLSDWDKMPSGSYACIKKTTLCYCNKSRFDLYYWNNELFGLKQSVLYVMQVWSAFHIILVLHWRTYRYEVRLMQKGGKV